MRRLGHMKSCIFQLIYYREVLTYSVHTPNIMIPLPVKLFIAAIGKSYSITCNVYAVHAGVPPCLKPQNVKLLIHGSLCLTIMILIFHAVEALLVYWSNCSALVSHSVWANRTEPAHTPPTPSPCLGRHIWCSEIQIGFCPWVGGSFQGDIGWGCCSKHEAAEWEIESCCRMMHLLWMDRCSIQWHVECKAIFLTGMSSYSYIPANFR